MSNPSSLKMESTLMPTLPAEFRSSSLGIETVGRGGEGVLALWAVGKGQAALVMAPDRRHLEQILI